MGNGTPVAEATICLGITAGTARTVLKRAFDKMGISRQTELVQMISRLTVPSYGQGSARRSN